MAGLLLELCDPLSGEVADLFLYPLTDVAVVLLESLDCFSESFHQLFLLLLFCFTDLLLSVEVYLLDAVLVHLEEDIGLTWQHLIVIFSIPAFLLGNFIVFVGLDVCNELIVVGESLPHVFGLTEGHRLSQVHAHFAVLVEQNLADVLQMFDSLQHQDRVQLLADFLTHIGEVLHDGEAVGSNPKRIQPTVDGIGQIGVKSKVSLPEFPALFVQGQHGFSHIDFVADIAVGRQKEHNSRKDEAE